MSEKLTLFSQILLVTKALSLQKGISRFEAVSHLFVNNRTAQSLCSWRGKCLGLRGAEKGQLEATHRPCHVMFQQAAGMVERHRKLRGSPTHHLPKWGVLLMGPLLADVYYFKRWEGCCWQRLLPVLEAAGKV